MKEHGVMPATKCTIPPGTIIGWRQDGRPIRIIAGGAPDGDEGGGGEGGDSGDQSGAGGGEGAGGAGGDAAPTVDDIRRLTTALERERIVAREGKVAARELAALKAQQGTDTDRAVAAARAEVEQEVSTKYQTRLVGLSVRAAAAKFADPTDAAVQLRDHYADFLDSDGDVDDRKVQKAVDDLLKAKPYLAANKQIPPEFDNGQRNGAGQQGGNSMDRMIRRNAGVSQQ